jgi:TolA-binding protein
MWGALNLYKNNENNINKGKIEARNSSSYEKVEYKDSITNKDNTQANNYNNLILAQELYNKNYIIKAINVLNKIEMDKLEGYGKEKYTELKEKIYPKAAFYLYGEGVNAYIKKDYNTAINLLSEAAEYGNGQLLQDDSYYMIVCAYKNIGNDKDAQKYIKALINNFPSSIYTKKVRKLTNK